MKSQNVQQEILVFTQTSFVHKVLNEKISNNKKSDPTQQLEHACWNGMLNKMLPELLLSKQQCGSEMAIWQISSNEYSLLIDMAEAPDMLQDAQSINPFLFLLRNKMN